ncbi:hypothetical protein ACLI09_01205 [Flavobacterium sp. RHBU_24]|uniref:hypothetical protein n=1 Tax=Flavobacterium sp. RHBU_24 TaxID=3391185 RepID=UPI0039846BA9
MIFKLERNSKFKNNFIDILNENLSYTIMVEFIIGLSSFSFISEFVLVPLYFFVGVLLAYSEINKMTISKKINKAATIFLLILFAYKIFDLVTNYGNYFNPDLIPELLLAPLLSIAFIPFLWVFFIYINYENVFVSLKLILHPKLLVYAKLKLFFHFGTNITGLKRWLQQMHSIHSIDNIDKIKIIELIKKIKDLQVLEKKPPKIDNTLGWSPYIANEYLKKLGLTTGFYFNYSGDEYWHGSADLSIGNQVLKNRISYYLNGREHIVTSLKLVLTIYDIKSNDLAFVEYLKYITTLYQKVFDDLLPEKLAKAFVLNKDSSAKIGSFEITIQRKIWNIKNGCYKIDFEIRHDSHID